MFRYHTAYESLRRERMKLGIELFRYVGVFQERKMPARCDWNSGIFQ